MSDAEKDGPLAHKILGKMLETFDLALGLHSMRSIAFPSVMPKFAKAGLARSVLSQSSIPGRVAFLRRINRLKRIALRISRH